MTVGALIAPHLPYLRRFARALTGSQRSGDAYAMATLEAVAADCDNAHDGPLTRLALFEVFLRIWGSLPVNNAAADLPASQIMDAADRTLESLTPLSRVVFLLRTVEGFTVEEIADILRRDTSEVDSLLECAGREIAAQLRTNVLIIEDEPIIAMDIETLVCDLGHTVMQIARTHGEAVAAIKRQSPGLVLADIQLADGSSGLEAVNEILGGMSVPVVFITAYPERLLTGERPEPTFLITKPFQAETVKAIISQALFFDRRASLVKGTGITTGGAREESAHYPAEPDRGSGRPGGNNT
ncbi:response regulator [Limobrevibacterium gyesilva]|uniref:response regulator n=1 Tax=Limobrevibacterium gyesilva TaxID=2991712 RepID=UPI0024C1FB9F|nr:response regulator [Limobrevibacterium gyesilva]